MVSTRTDTASSPDTPGPPPRCPHGLTSSILVIFLAVSTMTCGTASADAAVPYGVKAVAVAASKRGAPYAYGATGPKRFDCSGLTLYAFRKAGRKLPRTANQQYQQTRRIPPVQRAPGDLVFFPKGATMSHVGIYAGRGKIWHAPRPGGHVRLEQIWSRNVRYGRAG